jgi:hypothetical protein
MGIVRSILRPVVRNVGNPTTSRYSQNSLSSYWAQQWYGYELDEENSSPDVTRIASDMAAHAELPVHKLIRGCLLSDSGVVNYYLKADDWTKKADGTNSNLDGTDGQVMVEIPKFYHKIDNPSSGVYQHKISLKAWAGFTEVPKFYIGTYQAALNRTTLKLSSVKNLTTTYRGGQNEASWDELDNTLLGRPATNLSLISFRTYARNRGSNKWNVLPWRQEMLLYDLFIIEFATLNSQKSVNNNLTVDGYKQGGLGVGVTEFYDWTAYNSYNPFIPCGQSDSLANNSGEVSYLVAGSGVTVKIPRYRGVENPFGHIWEWHDGVSIYHQTDLEGGKSKFYTCDNPANFADETETNYDYRGDVPRTSGYLNSVTHDAKAIQIPKGVNGSSVTYFCDYHYSAGEIGSWVALFRGGNADVGAYAGFACSYASFSAAFAFASIGARLCFIP